jgi:tagatose-1,6-bisphosphate aldolase non-catalytic subunit AgaZ/GatZ
MNFRLGFGPMSREVIEILCNYSHNNKKPLMIIASRNQVDAESGYVMTTPQIREQLSTLPTDYIWMCRDHCGPYFLRCRKEFKST